MLHELRVRQLGVVEDAMLEVEPGMTAITGETGAGKTMVVEAIRLLTGGRGEARTVRTGATEAVIEGRFTSGTGVNGAEETVMARTVSASGKSRATINGRMVPLGTLTEEGSKLVDLHGQHAHQTLLAASAQREALDSFGKIDLDPLRAARALIRTIDSELSNLGGDPQTRAREIDLLRFQLQELDSAELSDPNEDSALQAEELLLADAGAHREAAAAAHEALVGDGGVEELLGNALKAVSGREPLGEIETALRDLVAAASEVAHDSGALSDSLRDDPERLAELQERRALIGQLLRKYGADLAEVMAYRDQSRARMEELDSYEETVNKLQADRAAALKAVAKQEGVVRKARLAAAPILAKDVESRLRELALPNARFEIHVGDDGAGDSVEFLLGPNPGMPLLPVAKAASGGELARTMLALRLALTTTTKAMDSNLVLIFDEVDAGIGGEAAVAVGRALAALSHNTGSQVMVVTHLPQVAAFADNQITVRKDVSGNTTIAKVVSLNDAEREIELARMLSGQPDSESGRAHARELLTQASAPVKKPRKKAAS